MIYLNNYAFSISSCTLTTMENALLESIFNTLSVSLSVYGNLLLFIDTQVPEVLNVIGDSRVEAAKLSKDDAKISNNVQSEIERVITELKGAYAAYYSAASQQDLGAFIGDAFRFLTARSYQRQIDGYSKACGVAACLATYYKKKEERRISDRWFEKTVSCFNKYTDARDSADRADIVGGAYSNAPQLVTQLSHERVKEKMAFDAFRKFF